MSSLEKEAEDIGINPTVLKKGLDLGAIERLGYRLSFISNICEVQLERIRRGNLASLEPEVIELNTSFQDMCNVLKELLYLNKRTLNQKEQGVALPPNGSACPSDAAQG